MLILITLALVTLLCLALKWTFLIVVVVMAFSLLFKPLLIISLLVIGGAIGAILYLRNK